MNLPFRSFPSPRRLLVVLLMAGGLATGATDAVAREPGPTRHPRFAMGQGDRGEARAELRAARQADRRAAMRGFRQPEAPMQRIPEPELPRQFVPSSVPGGADRAARPGRLTPDERRALRQQINEAGRDVYRPNGWR